MIAFVVAAVTGLVGQQELRVSFGGGTDANPLADLLLMPLAGAFVGAMLAETYRLRRPEGARLATLQPRSFDEHLTGAALTIQRLLGAGAVLLAAIPLRVIALALFVTAIVVWVRSRPNQPLIAAAARSLDEVASR